MLISLHLPKTAGTNFRALLESHYGDRLLDDYGDRPLHQGAVPRRLRAIRAGIGLLLHPQRLAAVDAVHGHFLALKYGLWRGGAGVRRVTWLRDPVERVASHYHYWRRGYNPATAGALQRRVVEEGWTLERFCLGPELRNVYQQFLWGVPVARLDFVGITEHYATDAQDFARRILGLADSPPVQGGDKENRNPEAPGRYVEDPALRDRIERHHAADMALYHWALRRRQARLQP